MTFAVLVTGVNGQDGSYVADLLIQSNIKVVGTSRYDSDPTFRIKHLLNSPLFHFQQTDYSFDQLSRIISSESITHIINLTGQSYVSRSWELIPETLDSHCLTVSNLLKVIIESKQKISLVNACSSEIYAESATCISLNNPKTPSTPYGCAKLYTYNIVKVARSRFDLPVSSAILFPHESLRRSPGFLFPSLCSQAAAFASNSERQIVVGNLAVTRDWGYALDYCVGMIRQVFLDATNDYMYSTGNGHSVKDIISTLSTIVGVDLLAKTVVNPELLRSYESPYIVGQNPSHSLDHPLLNTLQLPDLLSGICRYFKEGNSPNILTHEVTDYLNLNKNRLDFLS